MKRALLVFLLSAAPLFAQEDGGSDSEAVAEEAQEVQQVDPEIFDTALADYYQKKYAEAAAGFWGYIHFGDASAENYEWSQYFLAECMRHLGLWHAAEQYYYIVAKTRSRPEILPEALSRLEVVSRRRPFSETLINDDLVGDADFGSLPPELNNWVQFVQGLLDVRHGDLRWANRHFEQIEKESAYLLRSRYVLAVQALSKKRDDEALAMFGDIVDSKVDEPEVKNRAQLALARLLYDMGQYEEAQTAYDKVKQIDLSFEQAQLLLEKAWTAYQRKDMRKAMGYLQALQAPSYESFFLPDAYVLRGIILKEMCHFIPAKRVVRSFRAKYARALGDLHRRAPMSKVKLIVDGAHQDGAISRRNSFLKTLEEERKLVEKYDSVWEDVELDKHLRRLYDLEIAEQGRRYRIAFEDSADRVANELLETEEQVNLLDYEVGLDIFKRLKATQARMAKEEPLVVPYDSQNVYYEFDDEYWNDELHSYQYFINNRCFEVVEAP